MRYEQLLDATVPDGSWRAMSYEQQQAELAATGEEFDIMDGMTAILLCFFHHQKNHGTHGSTSNAYDALPLHVRKYWDLVARTLLGSPAGEFR